LGDKGLDGMIAIERNLNKCNVELIQLAHDVNQCGVPVYTQNYWVLGTLSIMLYSKFREQNVLENGFVSVIR
jgi:hypothetical protein